LALVALIASFTARAELPRLIPLFELEERGADRFPFLMPEPLGDFVERAGKRDGGPASPQLPEPVVFWSADGLLCAEAEVAGMVDCHDPVRGGGYGVPPVRRKRPAKVTRATTSLTLGSATLAPDGLVTNGEVKAVAKLRCRRSPLLDRKEYRYLPGAAGRLAVMVLEVSVACPAP
jgi:hypothetical protein